ncbi:hypothetical protein RRG08_016648 [Elysia crispata]|uniref:Uncharacterized protein n=1 Tax=Elysia crispata TaxID=231223 RepID=A0AAE1D8L4_9GAST|nr:hypothetical protein RRG08_016648 [Elysia crispata]
MGGGGGSPTLNLASETTATSLEQVEGEARRYVSQLSALISTKRVYHQTSSTLLSHHWLHRAWLTAQFYCLLSLKLIRAQQNFPTTGALHDPIKPQLVNFRHSSSLQNDRVKCA